MEQPLNPPVIDDESGSFADLPEETEGVYFPDVAGKSGKGSGDSVDQQLTKLDDRVQRLSEYIKDLEIPKKFDDLRVRVSKIEGRLEGRSRPWVPIVFGPILGGTFIGLLLWTHSQVVTQGNQISTLTERVNGIALRQAASNPTDPKSVKEVKNVLSASKKQGAHIASDVVGDVGVKFIDVAQSNPVAWTAAEACFDYVSFLNIDRVKPPKDIRLFVPKQLQGFSLGIKPPPGVSPNQPWELVFQISAAGKDVSRDQAAVLAKVSKTGASPGTSEWLVIDSKAKWELVLDGEFMKNVIIRGTQIDYDGGPIVLQNVYFVNCTFNIKMCPSGVRLGQSLLASASVNFSEGQTSSATSHNLSVIPAAIAGVTHNVS